MGITRIFYLGLFAACMGIVFCKTPSTIASEQWTKNAVAIQDLKSEIEKAEERLETEEEKDNPNPRKVAALKSNIDAMKKAGEALETSNRQIGELTARADIAEKERDVAEASRWKWFFYGLGAGLALGIGGMLLFRRAFFA